MSNDSTIGHDHTVHDLLITITILTPWGAFAHVHAQPASSTCCDCAKSLLPGSIPYLKLDALSIQLNGPNLEVNPGRRAPRQPLHINITQLLRINITP
jgi:hypothetical protein